MSYASPVVLGITTRQSADGPLNVGQTVTFTLDLSAPVLVDASNGLPSLTLSNNGTATLDDMQGGQFTAQLVFTLNVTAGTDTADLQVTGLDLNGGTLRDLMTTMLDSSDIASVPGADTGIAIDTTPPAAPTALPSVYFTGQDAAGHTALWVTDGTSSGTHEVAVPGAWADGLDPANLAVENGTLIFTGLTDMGTEALWTTNGSTATALTVPEALFLPGALTSGGFAPASLTAMQGKIYFSGTDDNGANNLWISGGSSGLTLEAAIQNQNASGLNPTQLTVIGDTLYFAGTDSSGRTGLFATQGGYQIAAMGGGEPADYSTELGASFWLYDPALNPTQLTALGDNLYFVTPLANGHSELRVTFDGIYGDVYTPAIPDASADGVDPTNLTATSDALYFQGTSTAGQRTLYVIDSTVTVFEPGWNVTEINPAGAYSGGLTPTEFTQLGAATLFSGLDSAGHLGLWSTDGTVNGTIEITASGASSDGLQPTDLTILGGHALFSGLDAAGHLGLWVTDGTDSGTVELTGITGASANGLAPQDMTVWNNDILFQGYDAAGLRTLWITDGTAAGTHELTAYGAAASGMQPTGFTVGANAAGISLTPASDSGVQGDGITNVTTPTYEGQAEAGSTVALYDSTASGDILLGTGITGSNGLWSVTSTALQDGTHTLYATATDLAGNTSADSATVTLTVQTAAPATPGTPSLDAASDTGSLGDGMTTVTDPLIDGTGTAGDTVSLVVQDVDGIVQRLSASVNQAGTWSAQLDALATGTYALSAQQTDVAGNSSAFSPGFILTIGTSGTPAVPGTPALAPGADSGAQGDGITNDTTPTLTGTAEAGTQVTLLNGASILGTAIADQDGTWSITTGHLADGVYDLTAIAANVAFTSAASAPFALTIDATAPAAPTLALGSTGDTLAPVTSPGFSGTAEAGSRVTVRAVDGYQTQILGTATAAQDGTWSLTAGPLGDGDYAVTADATDAAGNTSPWSAASGLTIDGGAVEDAHAKSDPLFDTAWFNAQYPGVVPTGMTAYQYFMSVGWTLGENPSPYFDTNYYLTQNPDVAAAGMNPLAHYEQYGWHEGRNPSAAFNGNLYLAQNPDVAAAQMDPLEHYIVYGEHEGRAMPTLTDNIGVTAAWYDATYADVAAAGMDTTLHYEQYGWHEGRNPDPWFDTNYYLAHNPDVAAAHMDPLLHYEEYGWKEGRDPSAQFSTNQYLAHNPDVVAAGLDPLLHYIEYGQYEGRAIYHT